MKKLLFFIAIVVYGSITAQCTLPVLTDFECSGPAVGSYPTTLTTVVNFDKSGINSSDNIGKYDDNGTEGFDAIIFDYGSAIDLSTTNFLKLKFHTTKEVQLLVKLEGGSEQIELYSNYVPNEELNTWVEFVFDFSAYSNNSSGGGGNTKLVIFVNPGVTTGNNPDTYYVDDIKWETSATASLDNVSKSNTTIFPTLFKETVNIKSEENIKEINVFNINGTSVFKKTEINANNDIINLSKLNIGYYFLKITTDKSTINSKILKQ